MADQPIKLFVVTKNDYIVAAAFPTQADAESFVNAQALSEPGAVWEISEYETVPAPVTP